MAGGLIVASAMLAAACLAEGPRDGGGACHDEQDHVGLLQARSLDKATTSERASARHPEGRVGKTRQERKQSLHAVHRRADGRVGKKRQERKRSLHAVHRRGKRPGRNKTAAAGRGALLGTADKQVCNDNWPTTTDSAGQSAARFQVDVNMYSATEGPYCPDACYTSIYQYGIDVQASVDDDTGDWGQYTTTETQQFVYTNTPELNKFDFQIFVTAGDGGVQNYQVSLLGNGDASQFTQVFDISADQAENQGIDIYWSQIAGSAFNAPSGFGSYSNNPLHVSIIPLNKDFQVMDNGLVVLIAGTEYGQCKPEDWCDDQNRPAGEICCYLKADSSTDNTLRADFLSNYQFGDLSSDKYACFENPNGHFQMPEDAGNGIFISSLNNLIKANPNTPIRIVVDAQTTVDFPISNYFRGYNCDDNDDSTGCTDGYDTALKVTVDGFGRINGYYAMAKDLNHFDTMTEYQVWARLAWISGDQSPSSGSGWPAAMGTGPFAWADGQPGGAGSNDGDPSKYGVVVQHVQFGYGPPISDAPVSLGDFGYTGDYQYGAATMVFDVKFVSFSTRSDGISMRDPASYGKALFIHGSDDILKTVTGVQDEVTWAALAVTFFAGFGVYGSLNCPCCFGPTGGFEPWNVPYCRDILVHDVLVPVLYAPFPSGDCYNAPGLVATKWGVLCEGADNPLDFPMGQHGTIVVENIQYSNWLIVDSTYNYIGVPLVNWMMNSNVGGVVAEYQLDGEAVKFENFFSDSYIVAPHGMLEYNWGVGASAATVTGTGTINTYGLLSHMFGNAPCNGGDGGDYAWAPCPTQDANAAPQGSVLDSASASNCVAYDGDAKKSFGEVCAPLPVDTNYPSASVYGDNACPTNFCGLRFDFM